MFWNARKCRGSLVQLDKALVCYAKIEQGNDAALVFRTSAMSRPLPAALAELTGRSLDNLNDRNVARRKEYAELYNDPLFRVRRNRRVRAAMERVMGLLGHSR